MIVRRRACSCLQRAGLATGLLAAAVWCTAPIGATAAPKAPRPGMTDCSSAQQAAILNRIGIQAYQQCTQHGGTLACDGQGFACCGPNGCDNFVDWAKRVPPRLMPAPGGGVLDPGSSSPTGPAAKPGGGTLQQ